MHQRKAAIDTDSDKGRIDASGATIAYGHHNGNSHQSNAVNHALGDVPQSAKTQRSQRTRTRRKPRSRTAAFEFPMQTLSLPAMILFGILWIRFMFKIGTNSGNDTDTGGLHHSLLAIESTTTRAQEQPSARSLFKLESELAPRCRNPGSPRNIDTTLVTQLSDDRLWMMRHHCQRYGPHSMAIAVYSNSTLEELVDELVEMGCRIDGNGHANVDGDEKEQRNNGEIMKTDDDPVVAGGDGSSEAALVSIQVLDAQTHGAWNDYPVNKLRNLALTGVRTTHITYIDVDFWPSEGLYEEILSPAIQKKLFDDPKLALVIPAFQLKRGSDCRDETLDCREEHVPRMPRTTTELKEMVLDQKVEIFDPTNRGGHGSTDYQHWFLHQLLPHNSVTETSSSNKNSNLLYEIPCLKSHRYEPFVTIRYCRELTPPFQDAFSGYGKNKMTWMMQVVASGFVFSQVGGAYLVHYPHAISKSRQDWNKAPQELVRGGNKNNNYSVRRPQKSDGDLGFDKFHRGQVDDLYIRFKEWLEKSIPKDKARLAMCEDAQDDDSKLWIDPNRKQWKKK